MSDGEPTTAGTAAPDVTGKLTRRSYSADEKAKVLAALLSGDMGLTKAAEVFGIPKATISRWWYHGVSIEESDKLTVGELLMGYLRTNLVTLSAQSRVFADPEWLLQQKAHEAAILHGVIADKTLRLLEALSDSGMADATVEGEVVDDGEAAAPLSLLPGQREAAPEPDGPGNAAFGAAMDDPEL